MRSRGKETKLGNYLCFSVIRKNNQKMDDCSLEKLSIKPGKLSPVFHKDTLLYDVTLGSNVEKITFDPQTSDTGASYSIWVINSVRSPRTPPNPEYTGVIKHH